MNSFIYPKVKLVSNNDESTPPFTLVAIPFIFPSIFTTLDEIKPARNLEAIINEKKEQKKNNNYV